MDKSLTSGSMGMMLLKLLSEKDMYGYEMIETLRQRSQNVFELKAGTLYPLLHSLEAKGFLTSYEQEQNGKTRVYYRITKNGNMFLKEKKEEWTVYVKAVSDVLALNGARTAFVNNKERARFSRTRCDTAHEIMGV